MADLQAQRGSNKKMLEKKDSGKWLNNHRINVMTKATTYHLTHFVMETANLVPFAVS